MIVMEGVINSNKMLMYKIYGHFILRNIATIVVTRYILQLKCTKFYFGWGSAPDPDGELTAPSRPLAGFKRPYF